MTTDAGGSPPPRAAHAADEDDDEGGDADGDGDGDCGTKQLTGRDGGVFMHKVPGRVCSYHAARRGFIIDSLTRSSWLTRG